MKLIIVLLIILSYLYGSIPFALIIGKIFYKTDIREYGSGNLGGTNAGRVLGKKAGICVIILDATKAIVVTIVSSIVLKYANLNIDFKYICALACMIGHCYPIFAGFKGGKAVASAGGYFLVINPLGTLGAFIVFLVVLKIFKYVSLSSISAVVTCLLMTPFIPISTTGKIINLVIGLLIIYRHYPNIIKIKNGTENKVSWM